MTDEVKGVAILGGLMLLGILIQQGIFWVAELIAPNFAYHGLPLWRQIASIAVGVIGILFSIAMIYFIVRLMIVLVRSLL